MGSRLLGEKCGGHLGACLYVSCSASNFLSVAPPSTNAWLNAVAARPGHTSQEPRLACLCSCVCAPCLQSGRYSHTVHLVRPRMSSVERPWHVIEGQCGVIGSEEPYSLHEQVQRREEVAREDCWFAGNTSNRRAPSSSIRDWSLCS